MLPEAERERGGGDPDAPARRTGRDSYNASGGLAVAVSHSHDTAEARHRTGVLLFLIAAAASFVLSIALWFGGNREEGVFVGLWVPSILAAGAFWIAAVRTR